MTTTYNLNKKDTGRKSGRFHYTITDATGKILSERKSDREYVAATINGQYYFGRLDLIGKGDHGKQVKILAPDQQTPIAYLVAEPSAPVQEKPVMTVDELAYRAWIGEKKSQYKQWQIDGLNGTINDDANPCFLFSGTFTTLLVKVANGEISAGFLASQELANRGLDKAGNWVGFDAAEKIHFPK